jgi:hypothetical protein
VTFFAGKFSSYINIDDENETEIDVVVEYDGHADRGDNWTPPSTEMNVYPEPAADLPEGVTRAQFDAAATKAKGRLTEEAFEWESK